MWILELYAYTHSVYEEFAVFLLSRAVCERNVFAHIPLYFLKVNEVEIKF